MARQKKHEKEPNHERWLVSYGDLLTLLFAVFVVLYAMSQSDKKKAEEVSSSIRASFGMIDSKGGASIRPAIIDTGNTSVVPELKLRSPTQVPQQTGTGKRVQATENDFRIIKSSIDAYLLKAGKQNKVSVDITKRGLIISLKEAGFFESGSAVMKKDSADAIATIANMLNQYSNRCRIEGHTDNIPINGGNYDSNWDLSTARATGLVKKLIQSYGIDPKKVSAAGYGEFQPVADNETAEGRAKNRRVDLVILSAISEYTEPQNSSTLNERSGAHM
jgi:chemotaxis protein MotB